MSAGWPGRRHAWRARPAPHSAACPLLSTDGAPRVTGAWLARLCCRGHVFRALLESICFGTEQIFETMASHGYSPTSVAVAGGATRSDLWMGIHADVSNVPFVLTRRARLERDSQGHRGARRVALPAGAPSRPTAPAKPAASLARAQSFGRACARVRHPGVRGCRPVPRHAHGRRAHGARGPGGAARQCQVPAVQVRLRQYRWQYALAGSAADRAAAYLDWAAGAMPGSHSALL